MGCVLTFVDALHDVKYFVICYASVVQFFDDSVFGGRVLLLQHEPKTNRRRDIDLCSVFQSSF